MIWVIFATICIYATEQIDDNAIDKMQEKLQEAHENAIKEAQSKINTVENKQHDILKDGMTQNQVAIYKNGQALLNNELEGTAKNDFDLLPAPWKALLATIAGFIILLESAKTLGNGIVSALKDFALLVTRFMSSAWSRAGNIIQASVEQLSGKIKELQWNVNKFIDKHITPQVDKLRSFVELEVIPLIMAILYLLRSIVEKVVEGAGVVKGATVRAVNVAKEEAKQAAEFLKSKMAELALGTTQILRNVWNEISNKIPWSMIEQNWEKCKAYMEKTYYMILALGVFLSEIWNGIKSKANDALERVNDATEQAFQSAMKIFWEEVQKFSKHATKLKESIVGKLSLVTMKINKNIETIRTMIEVNIERLEAFKEMIKEKWINPSKKAMQEKISSGKEAVQENLETLMALVYPYFDSFKTTALQFLDQSREYAQTKKKEILDALKKLVKLACQVYDALSWLFWFLKEKLIETFQFVGATVQEKVLDPAGKGFETVKDHVKKLMSKLLSSYDKLKVVVMTAANFLKEQYKDLTAQIDKMTEPLLTNVENISKAANDSIQDIQKKIGETKEEVQTSIRKIQEDARQIKAQLTGQRPLRRVW